MKNLSLLCIRLLLLSLFLSSCIDGNKPGTFKHIESISVDSTIVPDSTTLAFILPYKSGLDEQMNTVIGTASADIIHETRGGGETSIGNFVVDAQWKQAVIKYGKPIDFSLMNAHGGIRASIPKGEITIGTMFQLMPFENEMLVLTLPSEIVRELFDYSATRRRNAFANASYTIRDGKADEIKISGKPLLDGKTYSLAVSDYLAGGGDGHIMLAKAISIDTLNYKLRDMLIDFVKSETQKGRPVRATIDGRMKE